jgi:hypothetical protein
MYSLSANYKGERRSCSFYAEDDYDATFSAIAKILDKAKDSQIWAKGYIELKNGEKVLRTMPEKE